MLCDDQLCDVQANGQEWKVTPAKSTTAMVEAGLLAKANNQNLAKIYEAMLAAAPQPPEKVVPPEVMVALDRMCVPLHESYLKGTTAQEDARCMAIIRDYILK